MAFHHFEDNFSGISKSEFLLRLPEVLKTKTINLISDFKDWEIVDLYLTENRIINNAILINEKYLVANRRVVEIGQVARDRISNFSVFLKPTIFELFNFETIDIITIKKVDSNLNKIKLTDLETKEN
jgi:hypothetical protein